MPYSYFSLRDTDSDSDSDSGESDDSIPELQTCPMAGQRASSKLHSISSITTLQLAKQASSAKASKPPSTSSHRDDFSFAGGDRFSPKKAPVSVVKTPKPIVPKPSPDFSFAGGDRFSPKPASVSVVKTPKPILPKPSPDFSFAGGDRFSPKPASVSVVKTPKPILPKPSPLQEFGTLSVLTTPQTLKSKSSSPLLGVGSVSLLKTPKAPKPKFTPTLERPGPSTSVTSSRRSDSVPWTDILSNSKLPNKEEWSETPSSSSCGSSPVWSEPDSAIGKDDHDCEEAKPKITVPPDWHGLLFGGVEKPCDEILTRPEVDTSYEDCKLAEDVALNFVTNYDLPVFDCLRDFHTTNLVSHTVKKIPKKFKSRKEQLIALLLMLDYLSCCCQKGNLLPLYEKCKDKNKVHHLESIDQSIRLLLDRLHSDRLSLKQLRSVDQFVKTCIDRIPSSLRIPYFSVPTALKRKLKVFEMEEKSAKENSVYNFTSNSPKKSKLSSIKSTSNKWELEDMDYNDLLRTPTKSGKWTTAKSPLSASTPQSTRSVSIPTASNSGSSKRNSFSASTKDEGEASSRKPPVAQKNDRNKITQWLFQKNTPPKTNSGVTSLTSKQREMSQEVSGINSSRKRTDKFIQEDEYSSDDSLPDIPDIVIPEQESSSYASWKRRVLGSKAEVNSSNSVNSSEADHKAAQGSSSPACKSPFKANHNTWKSKYESPSKSFLKVGSSFQQNQRNSCSPFKY